MVRILGLTVSALLLSVLAVAQAPPPTKTPVAPKTEQLDPDAYAHSDAPWSGRVAKLTRNSTTQQEI